MNTFTLTDADGNAHDYEIIAPHAVPAGASIMFELAGMLAGPLSGLMAKGGADLSAVGPALGQALLGLGDLKLVGRILAHTTRDGKPLANAKHLNDAYQRNYTEMIAACWEVIKYNRFLSLPAGMSGVLKAAAAKLVLQAGSATPSGPPPSA